uniref:Uncharacterized protein n=1 Tax=Lygus hesperus TaxID=30085 RepID=A0A146MDP5_LYGHE
MTYDDDGREKSVISSLKLLGKGSLLAPLAEDRGTPRHPFHDKRETCMEGLEGSRKDRMEGSNSLNYSVLNRYGGRESKHDVFRYGHRDTPPPKRRAVLARAGAGLNDGWVGC